MLVCRPRHHNKKKLLYSNSFPYIPHLVIAGIYQRFFKYIDDFSTYISDFFIISTIRHRISTYRQFSAIYLYSIPRHYNKKEVTLTATSFPYTPSSTNQIISAIFQIYRRFLHLYQRFFSLYRRFDTGYRLTDIFRH